MRSVHRPLDLDLHVQTSGPQDGRVDQVLAMFELTIQDEQVKIVEERHYHLTAAEKITAEDLKTMAAGG